jgi:hypothetical protein
MRPVPSQIGQAAPSLIFPVPLQFGHKSSPVPGVPATASSPGLRWASDLPGVPEFGVTLMKPPDIPGEYRHDPIAYRAYTN